MKPFNLEAAERGEPICTGDGKAVKFVAHIPDAVPHCRVIAMLVGSDLPFFRHENGRLMYNNDASHDLFMAPKKRTLWVNVLSMGASYATISHAYTSQAQADLYGGSYCRIGGKAWPLEIEE